MAALDCEIGVGSTEFHVVRPGLQVDTRYLLHYLRQDAVRQTGELRMTGSAGQRRVPPKFLADLVVPLPPLDEQQRIAAILDQADAIRSTRAIVGANVSNLPQALFRDKFGPPADWAGRWPSSTIGEVAESVQYGTSARAGSEGDWPVLRMGNLTDDARLDLEDLKYLDLNDEEIEKYTVRRGDLLFNRTNSVEKVGKAAVVHTDQPFAFAGYLVRVRFENTSLADFIATFLTGGYGRALRRGMAKAAVNQANISAREMRSINIPLPPEYLMDEFSQQLGVIRARERQVSLASLTDDALFASLQSRAFKGEL